MQTIEKTYEKTAIPAVRRTDEIAEKMHALYEFIAESVNGLTRAEIGVMRSAIGGDGTSVFGVTGAQYCDGFDPNEGRWIGGTRRLSDKALDKAIRSLLAKGLIRFEGQGPLRANRFGSYSAGLRYSEVHFYGAGNSGIFFDEDGDSHSYGESSVLTHQQAAAWYSAWYSGLVDEKKPDWYIDHHQKERVKIVAPDALTRAYDEAVEIEHLVRNARTVARERDWLDGVSIAEIVKPDPLDMLNAVSRAYQDAEREFGDDPKEIYLAMSRALDGFGQAAVYGEIPDGATTPGDYENRAEYMTEQVRKINARIMECVR
jgi:hypothetical protein